jgi:protein-tyrosine phosphatase
MMKKILFVCTGNICRSPSVEGVFRSKLEKLGILQKFTIDSAALYAYHVGETPDYRAINEAERRGIDLNEIHARQIILDDFYEYDLILGMTDEHINFLEAKKPQDSSSEIDLFLKYAGNFEDDQLADPFYGGENAFTNMFDRIETACDKIISKLTS